MTRAGTTTVRLAVLASLASACASAPRDISQLGFAPQLNVRLDEMTRLPSGLYLRDEVVGTGAEALRGATVTLDYVGWLHNGRAIDSSASTGPIKIDRLGHGTVIRGWDEGLQGMRAGGRRLLVIPPNLAYGSRSMGEGAVPPNSTLVFRVELRTVTR